MKFTDDRISQIAHLIQDNLYREKSIDEAADKDKVLYEVKKTLIDYFKVEDAADQAAREKVEKLKRGVLEGSREWEILYRKYFEEELSKKGHY